MIQPVPCDEDNWSQSLKELQAIHDAEIAASGWSLKDEAEAANARPLAWLDLAPMLHPGWRERFDQWAAQSFKRPVPVGGLWAAVARFRKGEDFEV